PRHHTHECNQVFVNLFTNNGQKNNSDSPPAFTGRSFQSRPASRAPAAGYRSRPGPAVESSDSDGDSSSDEEAATWRRKRQKVTNTAPAVRVPASAFNPMASAGRKVNNIWGSVVQEQCQDAITAELGVFGMEGELDMSSRNVETYNYVLARKMMEKERELEMQSKGDGEVSMLDEQLEEYMKGKGSGDRGDKRKRPIKERWAPRRRWTSRETKRTKDRLDRESSGCDWNQNGHPAARGDGHAGGNGRRVHSGRQQETHSWRGLPEPAQNTPSVSRSQLKKIFLEENKQEQKSKKAAQKRRRHLVAKKMKQAIGTLNLQEHDDVSRETFASDTNEALEALEDGPEEEEEAAGEEEEEETHDFSPFLPNLFI
uniref:Phosphorylated adaptor for RNA export n=1 Tax=Neogobius melanostomus TaxID=47308 RepID=A0A8C6TWD8_9GOBI